MVEAVASHFGLTRRTLNRRLVDDGTTFKELAHATRLIGVRHTLLHSVGTNVRFIDISEHWGYANPSGLTRSYYSFFNELPRETRARYRMPKRN